MSESLRIKVIHTVTNYIDQSGGIVSLEDLLHDYEIAYRSKLPFVDLGYSTVEDFLISVDGVSICEDRDGKMYIEYSESYCTERREDCQTNEMDDMKLLTIQMRNSLQLDSNNNDRVVTMRSSEGNTSSEEVPSRTDSWPSNRTEEISSDGSVRSSPAQGPGRNASTHQYPEDNLSGSRSNNHSTFKNVPIFSLESHSNTENILRFPNCDAPKHPFVNERAWNIHIPASTQELSNTEDLPPLPTDGVGNCDAPEYPFKNERRAYYNIHIPGTLESSSMQPNMNLYGANLFPSNGYQTEDSKDKVWTLDGLIAYSSGLPLNVAIELRKRWDAIRPTLFGTDASFPDISVPSFPENSDARTFQSISSYKDPMLSTLANDSSSWIPKEMCKSSPSVYVTNDEMVDRIVKLVNSIQSFGGIDTKVVELKYLEKYSMTLPQWWQSLLEERNILYLERLTMCSMIYPSRFFPVPPTMSSLPALRYRNDYYFWNVHVTLYESTTCVWFRLKDEVYEQKYEILKRKMNRYYMNFAKEIKVSGEVATGQLCVVNYRKQWSRCEVRETDTTAGWVKCLLLDEGRTEKFPSDRIYALNEKFTNTPALILQGQLYSLEKWANCQYMNNKIKQYLPEECDVGIKIHEFLGHNRVSFGMNVETETGSVELNSKMVDLARTELNLPVLYVGQTYNIFILNIADSNGVKIHIDSPALRKLEELMYKATDAVGDPKIREPARVIRSSQISANKIYLTFDGDLLKRIECLRQSSESQFHARFIDFAEEKLVYLHDIFDMSMVPDTACFIEPQAVRIKVLDADMVALRYLEHIQLRQLPPLQISFVMKILHLENIPLVQLFVKISGSNEPLPITNFLDSLQFARPPTSNYQ